MVRIQNPTVQLPAERLEQLKLIKGVLGEKSISSTIAYLINEEIKRGTITNSIPGIIVQRAKDSVLVGFHENECVKFTLSQAKSLSDHLKEMVETDQQRKTVLHVGLGKPGTIDFDVARVGNAIRVTIDDGSKYRESSPTEPKIVKNLTHDLALDFARLIDNSIE